MANKFFRELNRDDLGDFQPVGKETPQEAFKKQVIKHEQACTKKGLPFAAQVVQREFSEEIQAQVDKIQRLTGRNYLTSEDKAKVKIPKVDWARYSDLKNFTIIEEGHIVDKELSKFHRMNVAVQYIKYQFKGYSYIYQIMEDEFDALDRARKKLPTEKNLAK